MSQTLTQASDTQRPAEAGSQRDLYADRRLSEGYPGLDRLALKNFTAVLEAQPDAAHIVEGACERIPVADGSQQIVFCDSVLEHVVSLTRSLDEMYRVLAPGG